MLSLSKVEGFWSLLPFMRSAVQAPLPATVGGP
jgi:hypothetical protein